MSGIFSHRWWKSTAQRKATIVKAQRTCVPHLETLGERINPSGGLLPRYEIGTPSVTDYWVDPVNGSNSNPGTSRGQAFRTLTQAWNQIPMNTTLTTGYRLNLVDGIYSESISPNYWESRHGTASAPVIVQAADGAATARLPNINMYDCRYVYFIGLDLSAGGGDVLHLDSCRNILVRDTTIRGTGNIHTFNSPQETFKANQCQYLYVEDCDISGAYDNAVDFVAVQHGHVVGSKIHHAVDWAMYAKGGSAYLTIAGNEFFDAGTGGFTAGQGTGFEFMVAPWIHYEAYDIQFINNVVHDVEGAGFGINGGYNILMAYNTLYHVGARSHVIEVVHGSRTCDGNQQQCSTFLSMGGWGTTTIGGDEPIPDRNVYIFNNVIFNPDGQASQWQHFQIGAARIPGTHSNIASPSRTDVNLQIKGNLIWNGEPGHSLGIESATLAEQVTRDNAINSIRPSFVNPGAGDYRLTSNFVPPASVAIPTFSWSDAPTTPAIPVGRTSTTVGYDFTGAPRSSSSRLGAFASSGEQNVPVDLSLSFSSLPSIPVGSEQAVTLTARNAGANAISGASVTLDWPSTVALVRSEPSAGSVFFQNGVVNWMLGSLAVDASATLTVTLRPRVSGEMAIVANGTTGGTETTPADNSVTLTLSATPLVRPGIIVAGSGVGGPAVVKVYDATTRVEKYTLTPYGTSFRGGVRVASADVTGDGHADVITVPGPGMAAWVRVFDGRDGTPVPGPIGRFLGFASSVTTGAFVSAGDVDADGRADVILGTDAGTIARVRIFNGANATFMRMIVPFGGFTGGVRVAAADVNGDGRAEVVTAPGLGRFPVVKAFHASTGATLWSFLAGNRSFERGLFVAAGDADGDGRDDILIGMGAGETTTLRLYRGSNRQLMQSYAPFESGYMGGARTAMLDLDGDGRADPLAGTGSLATSQIILGSASGSSISPFEDPIRAVFVAAGYSTRT